MIGHSKYCNPAKNVLCGKCWSEEKARRDLVESVPVLGELPNIISDDGLGRLRIGNEEWRFHYE